MPRPDPTPTTASHGRVLGVDLGLRTGFACYGPMPSGAVRLEGYGSHHIRNRQVLRRASVAIIDRFAPISLVVVEGDAALGRIWERAAVLRGAEMVHVTPERWRSVLLLDRDRRNGRDAKKQAHVHAEAVIDWARRDGSAVPAAMGELRHDTAEAILIGLWGVLQQGLVRPDEVPWPLP